MELDALAETEAGQKWVVEVKWRNKRAGPKELEALHQKAQAHRAQPWLISRAGFTGEALGYARRHQILVSDGAAVDALALLLGTQ